MANTLDISVMTAKELHKETQSKLDSLVEDVEESGMETRAKLLWADLERDHLHSLSQKLDLLDTRITDTKKAYKKDEKKLADLSKRISTLDDSIASSESRAITARDVRIPALDRQINLALPGVSRKLNSLSDEFDWHDGYNRSTWEAERVAS